MSIDEHIHYTPDGKGFILYADDETPYEIKNFADVYDKDKFYDLMKKGGKARDWVARHNLFGYYVLPNDYDTRERLTPEMAKLLALPRYMSDESWYDKDNYFWMKLDEFDKPLIAQLRISNHNTSHQTFEKNHSNNKANCQTCLNVIIGDKAYNRDGFDAAVGDDAIISVETFFDEDKRTTEQITFFENFVERVRNGEQPSITMDEIRTYIDPKARVVISQSGKEIISNLANIRPSQYDRTRKNIVPTSRLSPRAWNTKNEDNTFIIPKAIAYSDVCNGDTKQEYVDRKDRKTYKVFVYNGKRFAFDYGELVAYYIKNNGNLSKDNPIEILDENKRKKYNILEDKNMKIYSKRNNGLRKLGEGRIYSKRQLILNELDANIGMANGIQQAQMKAKQLMNRNAGVTSASADAGKLDSQNDAQGGEGVELRVPVNATGPQLAQAQRMVKDQGSDDAQITFTKPQTSATDNGLGESRIIEMRKNSIPFSKKELSSFLKSL